MERRKVQRVGGSTYTVSLPKAWAEGAGVTAGSTVAIDVHGDDQLVVEPEPPADAPCSRLTLPMADESPERLAATVRAAYGAGVGELVLRAPSEFTAEQRRAVDRAATRFVGVALTTESETELVVRTLLDSGEVSVTQSVRQLQFTVLSLHRDAAAALVDGATPHVADRSEEAARLAALVDRHFCRGLVHLAEVDALGLNRSELFERRSAARALALVADEATRLAAAATDLEESPPQANPLATVAREARSAVENATAVVIGDADAAVALDALDTARTAHSSLEPVEAALSAEGSYRLGQAVAALRNTVEHSRDLAEIGLKTAVRRGEIPAAVRGE